MINEKTDSVKEERISSTSQRLKNTKRDSWNIAGDLPSSFKYALQGLVYTYGTQRNFRIHILISTIVLGLIFWLKLSLIKSAILVLTISSVLILELINTAIEAVVDLSIGRQFHRLAKIAKDSAAAAVLVASISALLIAFLILVPPLLIHLGS